MDETIQPFVMVMLYHRITTCMYSNRVKLTTHTRIQRKKAEDCGDEDTPKEQAADADVKLIKN